MSLPLPPTCHENLYRWRQIAAKDILPPPLRMVLQNCYSLSVQQLPRSPPPQIPPSPSPPPCAKPEVLGDNRIEQEASLLEGLTGDETEQVGMDLSISSLRSNHHRSNWTRWNPSVHPSTHMFCAQIFVTISWDGCGSTQIPASLVKRDSKTTRRWLLSVAPGTLTT